MPVELKEEAGGKLVTVHARGILTKEDYEHFVPQVERLIKEHGKIRVLFNMEDFHGWTCGALWEDTDFDVKHFRDIEALAMVGYRRWEEWMVRFCGPFTTAEVRYYDKGNADEARAWIGMDLAKRATSA
jgi:hypothetical protein